MPATSLMILSATSSQTSMVNAKWRLGFMRPFGADALSNEIELGVQEQREADLQWGGRCMEIRRTSPQYRPDLCPRSMFGCHVNLPCGRCFITRRQGLYDVSAVGVRTGDRNAILSVHDVFELLPCPPRGCDRA